MTTQRQAGTASNCATSERRKLSGRTTTTTTTHRAFKSRPQPSIVDCGLARIIITVISLTALLQLMNTREATCNYNNITTREAAAAAEGIGWWRWKYIEEQKPGFELLVHDDDSIDARLSNVQYTANSARFASTDLDVFNSGDPELDRRREQLVAGPKVNDKLCGRQLSQMLLLMDEMGEILEEMRRQRRPASNETVSALTASRLPKSLDERHIRLALVLDSFGHYESGALVGRFNSFGSPVQCSSTRLMLDGDNNSSSVISPTRYCKARLRVDAHLAGSLRARKRPAIESDTVIHVGICIPESCHSKSLRQNRHLFQRLVDSQFKLPKSMFLDESLQVDTVVCEPDQDSQLGGLPSSGKLLIALLVGWLALALYSTFCVPPPPPEGRSSSSPIYDALNLDKSWSDFMLTNDTTNATTRSRVQLDTLNPIKVIGCFYVVVGHAFLVHQIISLNLLKAYNSVELDPWISLLVAGTVITDTFFVITGMILTYIAMGHLEKRSDNSSSSSNNNNSKAETKARQTSELTTSGGGASLVVGQFFKNWFQISAARYLRLMPLYFLVFWFKKSLLIYLGSGPTRDRGYNRETLYGSCRHESWLVPVTLGAAYLPMTQQCLPQCWSLAGDILICILLVPVIIIMSKRPKLAFALLALAGTVSYIGMDRGLRRIEPHLLADMQDLRMHAIALSLRDISYLYTIPFYRLFPFAVGILAGYALYQYKRGEHLKDWPAWMKGPATTISAGFVWVTISTGPVVVALKPNLLSVYPVYREFFLLMPSGRLIWSVVNAILFLRMTTDWKDGYWMQKSQGAFWKIMAKLNLPILLIHLDVLVWDLEDKGSEFARYGILSTALASYMLCCLIGTLMHVLIENPVDKLFKSTLFEGGVNHRRARSQQHEGAQPELGAHSIGGGAIGGGGRREE